MIQKIRNSVADAFKRGEGVNYKKFIAAICLDAGVSERKAKEYVSILINAGEFILNGGLVCLNPELKGGEENGTKTT